MVPLTNLECELLERVAQDRDEQAIAVLADYWIERVDEARGSFVHLNTGDNRERADLADEEARLAQNAYRWRAAALTAGFTERDLVISDGFVQYPLCFAADEPLDGHPDIVRLSPRYYRLGGVLDHGDCIVYDAEVITPRTRSRAVIKVPRVEDESGLLDHEWQMLRRIEDPHVVRSLGWVTCPSQRALALEWCGVDLRSLIRTAVKNQILLGVDFVLSVAVQLFDALAAIHRAQIIHRDIRSDHVAITSDGTVRVLDFGTARCVADRSTFNRHNVYRKSGYTERGFRFRYMAPEVARGTAIHDVVDVYSATGLICELATNQHHIRGNNDFEVLQNIVNSEPTPPAELPPRIRGALGPGFAREAVQRPPATQMRKWILDAARAENIEIGPHVIARRLVELGVPC